MKICLYLELESFLKASGITSAIKNQRRALELNGVEYTSELKDDFDIIHLNIIGIKSLYLIKTLKKKGKKVIVHAHVTAEDFRESYKFSNEVAPWLRRYLSYYYNQADLVLCPSEYTKSVLRAYGVKKEIIAISNGIDADKFHTTKEKRETFRDQYALEGTVPFMVGHLFWRKGLESFINVARVSDRDFFWVGRRFRKVEDKRVKNLIASSPENIRFIEYVDDITSAYSAGDVFFFPSHCENQGIVILEAAACRKPLVVRDIPTYAGWLEHERDCLKARTDAEFLESIRRLEEDQSLRDTITENAYKMSRQHSLKNVGAQLKDIYEHLLKK